MPAAVNNPLVLRGMRGFLTANAKADRDTRLGIRREVRAIAQPVASTSEALGVQNISHIGPKWHKMRVGLSRSLAYVAPQERSRMTRQNPGRYARKKFAPRLMGEAMEPALRRHRPRFEAEVERMLDRIADNFNRGGP